MFKLPPAGRALRAAWGRGSLLGHVDVVLCVTTGAFRPLSGKSVDPHTGVRVNAIGRYLLLGAKSKIDACGVTQVVLAVVLLRPKVLEPGHKVIQSDRPEAYVLSDF